MSTWAPPRELGEYTIVSKLGSGMMGQVFLARDTLLARNVAVKFIAGLDPDAAARERFFVEARAAARVQHPNVVTIHRVGELDRHPYLVSEYVVGETLDRTPKPVHWRRALEIAVDLARGLAAAHRKGVIHRDLKPANAIIDDGGVAKLLDFGLAKLLEPHARSAPAVRPAGPPLALVGPPAGAEQLRSAATIAPTNLVADGEGARALTAAGAIMGTPDYMCPEAWRGDPATAAGDVYSLGAMLYELVSGRAPFADVPVERLARAVVEQDALPVALLVPAIELQLAAVIDRCLARDPLRRFESAAELMEALERVPKGLLSHSASSGPELSPYRGLRPYEAQHRHLFTGRSAEAELILERLRSEPFVVLTGDSGTGKSSLCRAAVLPAAVERGLETGRVWSSVPCPIGRHPLGAVAGVIAERLGSDPSELAGHLAVEPELVVQRVRRRLGGSVGIIFFFDQLEELVTVAVPEEGRAVARFIASLTRSVPGIKVLGTVRSDYLSRLSAQPGLGEEVSRAVFVLGPLSPKRLHDVITAPAHALGVRFESERLVEELVESAAAAQGGLPLLQFALAELWEARDVEARVITARALESTGGVAGALARHADLVLDELVPQRRSLARRILLRLVDADGRRASASEGELFQLGAGVAEVVDCLVRGRLVAAKETEGGTSYELAHEVLLTGWPTLRGWLGKDQDSRAVIDRVRRADTEWRRLGRPKEALWLDRRLEEASRLELLELEPGAREFLTASRRALARRRLLRLVAIASLPLIAGASILGGHLDSRRRASRKAAALLAQAEVHSAEADRTTARIGRLERMAWAQMDARDRAEGEQTWVARVQEVEHARAAFARATRDLEAALAVDPGEPLLRSRFVRVLYDRAMLEESVGHRSEAADLVERIAVHEEGAELLARYHSPGRLDLDVEPTGARVFIERYERSGGRRTPVPLAEEIAPLTDYPLAPGSYRLRIEAQGRAPSSHPIVISRGERLSLNLTAPPSSLVPPGFIYVAPGRFLFGSTADEESRLGFFDALPIHPVITGDYLISRTEVTLGEYLAFLDDLTPSERRARTPVVWEKMQSGSIRLVRSAAGEWTFEHVPGGTKLSARRGEKVVFPARSVRREQSWELFPVTGISALDAEAYTSWLSRTGRVPRARLCTEHEWERAARGADDRELPHGDRAQPDDAAFDQTYAKHPGAIGFDEVGSHPESTSPFGLVDVAGNAFEWTRSSLVDGEWVGRGGSYCYDAKTMRVTNRMVSMAELEDPSLGLRVCASVR